MLRGWPAISAPLAGLPMTFWSWAAKSWCEMGLARKPSARRPWARARFSPVRQAVMKMIGAWVAGRSFSYSVQPSVSSSITSSTMASGWRSAQAASASGPVRTKRCS